MRQIDRLLARAGNNNQLTRHECFLGEDDYSFFTKPMTMNQLVEARKDPRKAGRELTDLEMSIHLFTLRALNADGSRQYHPTDFQLLMGLPMEDLTTLASAMNNEAEEDGSLDIKSPDEAVEGGEPANRRTGRSGKAGKDAE